MNPHTDTLDIRPLRQSHEIPMAEVAAVEAKVANHPEAAAVARARISELDDRFPLSDPASVPALPTTQLVTDRSSLADRYRTQPDTFRTRVPSKLKPVLAAVGTFAIMLLLFKAPVIMSQVNYAFNKPEATPIAATAAGEVIPAESTITIPKINVHAPVVYEPSVIEANVQKSLESGVVHYGTTPKPGQPGNAAIFGHSSNDWWEPGNYKFVFVLLDKLSPGDRFTIDYESKRYTYEVTGSKIVEPTDLTVLAQTAEPTISLITCTPAGTSLRRLVVTAKQVDPAPSSQQAVAAAPTTNADSNLPGSAPGFMGQISDAWEGIVRGFAGLFGADKPAEDPSTSTTTPGQLPAVK